jgi:hypothetical protein
VSLEAALGWLWKLLSLARAVKVHCHIGHLTHQNVDCYFVRVINQSPFRKAVVTEVWFDAGTRIPVLNAERPLPKVLPPDEIWETWIPVAALPQHIRAQATTLARAKLSDDTTISSVPTPAVSPAGFVAG